MHVKNEKYFGTARKLRASVKKVSEKLIKPTKISLKFKIKTFDDMNSNNSFYLQNVLENVQDCLSHKQYKKTL